jgi:hypothetical protein
MKISKNLDDILESVNFTQAEKEGFNNAIQVARNYMRDGNIDMEKEFQSIVERVAKNEIQ